MLVRTTFIEGEAVDVLPQDSGGVIVLADGSRVGASRIVLATGNEPPCGLPGAAELQDHPAWIGNPWQPWENRLPPSGGTILLLGTGLTTVDAVITLRALGWQGVVHAVSRNGWLPHSHFRGIEYPDFPPPGVDLADLGLKKLLALMEHHCARLREMGANPAIIVDKMRPHTQRIWQRFTLEERAGVHPTPRRPLERSPPPHRAGDSRAVDHRAAHRAVTGPRGEHRMRQRGWKPRCACI